MTKLNKGETKLFTIDGKTVKIAAKDCDVFISGNEMMISKSYLEDKENINFIKEIFMIRTLTVSMYDTDQVGTLKLISSEEAPDIITLDVEGGKMPVNKTDLQEALKEMSRFHDKFIKVQTTSVQITNNLDDAFFSAIV